MTSLTPGAADNRWRQGLRSRRRVLMVVSLLTAWCLLVGAGLAQEPPTGLSNFDALQFRDTFQLWNKCAPIWLFVGGLPDDTADIDLTKERVHTLAESRLRVARLYGGVVLGLPFLQVGIGVPVSENRRSGAFVVHVSFHKFVHDDISDHYEYAATWDTWNYGIHSGDADYILQAVSEQVDRFILEYLRVNETACR